MKFRHNKKKNSAFIYEVLVLECYKAVLSKNKQLRHSILETIKTFFSSSTQLGKELNIYKAIMNTKNVDELSAEKIIQEAKREYKLLDEMKLLNEKNKLLFRIKKLLPGAFTNFVPNYKDLASISQIFNKNVIINTRVMLENEILKKMTSNVLKENKMVPIDSIVLNSFVKKFNGQYSSIHTEQKNLLNKWITSFADNGLELKTFLNEEIGRLKTELKKSLVLKEIADDTMMLERTKEVVQLLESFSKEPINEQMINHVIKIQSLIREIKT